MLANQVAAAIEASRLSQLDDIARTLWKAHGAGFVTAEVAQGLAERIEARRAEARHAARSVSSTLSRPPVSLFPPRRAQLARLHPERLGRRRCLAASAPLPPALAALWTVGELAVLRIVGDEVREGGACDRSLAEIAARAGVCRSLAQATMRRAARAGLVLIEERRRHGAKNLPNVVRIVSAEWLLWLRRGPRRRDMAEAAGIGSKKSAPMDTNSDSKSQSRTHSHRRHGLGKKRWPSNPVVRIR